MKLHKHSRSLSAMILATGLTFGLTACSSAEKSAMEDFLEKYTKEMDACEAKVMAKPKAERLAASSECFKLAYKIDEEWSKNHARFTRKMSERTGAEMRGRKTKLSARGKTLQDRI